MQIKNKKGGVSLEKKIHSGKAGEGRLAVPRSRHNPDLYHEFLADDPGIYHFPEKRVFGEYDLAGADFPQL